MIALSVTCPAKLPSISASAIHGFRIGASSAVTIGAFSAFEIAPCIR